MQRARWVWIAVVYGSLLGCATAESIDAGLPCDVGAYVSPMVNHDGEPVYWSRTRSVDLVIATNTPSEALRRAVDTWESAAADCGIPLSLRISYEGEGDIHVVFHVDKSFPYEHGRAGVTGLEASPGGELVEAVIDINADTSIDVSCDDVETVDLESVLLHELGHALGLDHAGDAESVMHQGIKPFELKRQLSVSDRLRLCQIYQCY